jgi:hypothetical protein
MKPKVTGVTHHGTHRTFAVSFDDGMIIVLTQSLEYQTMLSVGPDSYYLNNGKWPTEKNIEIRVQMGRDWVNKNKKRYKIKTD